MGAKMLFLIVTEVIDNNLSKNKNNTEEKILLHLDRRLQVAFC